jgi:hypothetical protein
MSASTALISDTALPLAYSLRLYTKEEKYEFLKLWRNKGFTLSTIGLQGPAICAARWTRVPSAIFAFHFQGAG